MDANTPDPVATAAPAAPTPIFQHARAPKAIVAAPRQRGNPLLACVRSTLVEYAAGLVPDYLAGNATAIIYISLKFQRVHPDYLQRRAEALREGRYRSKLVLCRVDLEQPEEQLEQVTMLAFHAQLSLVLAWTDAEAAQYLETLHRYQSKGADALMGKLAEGDHRARHEPHLRMAESMKERLGRSSPKFLPPSRA